MNYKKSFELLSLKDGSKKRFPVDEYILLDTEDTDKKYLANKEDIDNGYKKLELDTTTNLYVVTDVMVPFIYNTTMSNAITPVKEVIPRLGPNIRQSRVTKKEYDKIYKESLATAEKSIIIYDEDSSKLKLIKMSNTETVENGVVVFKRASVTNDLIARIKTVKNNITYNGFVYKLDSTSQKYLQPVRSEDVTYFMNQAQTAQLNGVGYVKLWKCFKYNSVEGAKYGFIRNPEVFVAPDAPGIMLSKFMELSLLGSKFIEYVDIAYREVRVGLEGNAFSEEELKTLYNFKDNDLENFLRNIIQVKSGVESL